MDGGGSAALTRGKARAREFSKAAVPASPFLMEYPMLISAFISRLKAYLRYRRNVEALSRLTDRELNDIGISRGVIEQIARDYAAKA
ncbi:Protein of unknown function DUF1127 [Rhabdaerophilaceae bacterium]